MEVWKLGNRSVRVRRRRSRRDGKRMEERKKERGRRKTTERSERSKKWPWAAGELIRRNDFSRIAAADWVSMADWN